MKNKMKLTPTQLDALRQIADGNYTGHSKGSIKALLRRGLIVAHREMHLVEDRIEPYRYEITEEGRKVCQEN